MKKSEVDFSPFLFYTFWCVTATKKNGTYVYSLMFSSVSSSLSFFYDVVK